MQHILHVSQNPIHPDSFPFIQMAIDSIPVNSEDDYLIHIEPGTYYEKINLNRPRVTIEGTSSKECIITYDDCAYAPGPDGINLGTFRSYTFLIDANFVTLKNLTIQNSSGFGKKVGQAIALYAEGDYIRLEDCVLFGHQDTLFTGPLPPKAFQKNGFVGPKEFSPRIVGHQYYLNCSIEGDIDFIFGSAYAFFENCTIISHALPAELYPHASEPGSIHGYITAASTQECEDYGYIFYACSFIGDAPKHSVYLGRPWREHACVTFTGCNFGEHIHPAGFHDWDKTSEHSFFRFSEGNNFGPGSERKNRADFVSYQTIDSALLSKLRNQAIPT